MSHVFRTLKQRKGTCCLPMPPRFYYRDFHGPWQNVIRNWIANSSAINYFRFLLLSFVNYHLTIPQSSQNLLFFGYQLTNSIHFFILILLFTVSCYRYEYNSLITVLITFQQVFYNCSNTFLSDSLPKILLFQYPLFRFYKHFIR